MTQDTQLGLIEEIATDGVINPEAPEVGIDVNIDLRQDDLQMFENEAGDLLLTTPEMDAYISPVPTSSGVITEVVVDVDSTTLTEIEPAEPEEAPDMDTWAVAETRIRTD